MQPMKQIPGLTVLEGRRRKSLIERAEEFFGTALGTAFGVGLFLLLYALVGTMEFSVLTGR